MAEILKVCGNAIGGNDMAWSVECPNCTRVIAYSGFSDSSETNKCKCGCEFVTEKVYFENGSFMK